MCSTFRSNIPELRLPWRCGNASDACCEVYRAAIFCDIKAILQSDANFSLDVYTWLIGERVPRLKHRFTPSVDVRVLMSLQTNT